MSQRAATTGTCSASCPFVITFIAQRTVRNASSRPRSPVLSSWNTFMPGDHGVLAQQLYRDLPDVLDELNHVERRGVLRPLFPGSFTGYTHRPRQLAGEVRAAELELVDLGAGEGAAALLADLNERMHDPIDRRVELDVSRALERVPELIGVGPHMLATGRRADPPH